MNRRDIKNKNKIADSDVGNDNELQPLQGFGEGGFNSNGINKFGEYIYILHSVPEWQSSNVA